jgi:uncharacterized membrane protein
MNILFWTLQVLLALHTAMGGVWKFTNPVQTAVPTLGAIPNGAWIALGVVDLLAALALVLPAFNKGWSGLIVIAAVYIVAEMLLYTVIHLASGHAFDGSVVYWLVVAALAGLLIWGRVSAAPL